jgi:serine/threonine protein phosphatase PrpC
VVKPAYHSFAYTTKGRVHQKEGRVCQDHSARYDGDGLRIVAVADGHSEANSFRSDRGAKFAVDCAITAIRAFVDQYPEAPPGGVLDGVKTLEGLVGKLVQYIVSSWQESVERDYKEDPFTADELARCDARHRERLEREEPFKAYGSTLIAAAVTERYWFGFHIGDGRFTVQQADGTFAQPVPWDERCFLHLTTSICDYEVNDRPRVHCEIISEESPPPIALFLCSDGIDDNYPVEDNEIHLYRLYSQIMDAFAADGFASASEQTEALCDAFAQNGKGDDTSLAILIDMGRVRGGAQAPDAPESPETRTKAQESGKGPEEAELDPGIAAADKKTGADEGDSRSISRQDCRQAPEKRTGRGALPLFVLALAIVLMAMAAASLLRTPPPVTEPPKKPASYSPAQIRLLARRIIRKPSPCTPRELNSIQTTRRLTSIAGLLTTNWATTVQRSRIARKQPNSIQVRKSKKQGCAEDKPLFAHTSWMHDSPRSFRN